ncbi:RNA 2',3'-cyclic phosphodiesterase [Caldovatus aquaticus]|uniref:RNA 2',3'-cyclic phosphodiesterase n=1 Tax=Caldovatus aquaticus TaxID=2865671 RepID=A0ABS7F5I5_9PROT|nr:RNA 2',3'-cyclic phosphodiesterase [Caldovatus aquaticus]MBW8270870.1 RNA 2',3'-cyclic phosphodiesterase [Caldovatus aquaticus]
MRLFVGLALPEAVRTQLAGLAGGIPGARWVPPENYHLTLRFIGEVESWRAQEIDDALSAIRARPLELRLRGIGTFEKAGRVQTLWVGVEKTEGLIHLQGKVETALQRVGLEPERRRFSPHVTLARCEKVTAAEKLAAFVQGNNLFRAAPVVVDRFCLFSSRLGKEQAVYAIEAEYALG